MIPSKIKTVYSSDISQEPVQEAARIIQQGGVVVFPTTGLYGIGADACNPAAIERVFNLKQRSLTKPLSVLVKDPDAVSSMAQHIPQVAQILMNRFWPGNLTLILRANARVPKLLTAGTKKIGVRVPAHPIATALLRWVDGPVTATSANISGHAGCSRITDLDPNILNGVELVLDAGLLKGGIGSTVVDVTFDPPKILREGMVSSADILAAL